MICLTLLLLAIHVATFRPLYIVSGWLGRHVAFFGKAYAQYAIADAVAWLAVLLNDEPTRQTAPLIYYITGGTSILLVVSPIVFDLIIIF